MHAGGISLPCDVHLIDVVGGVSGEERVIGILQNRQKSECQSELAFRPEMKPSQKRGRHMCRGIAYHTLSGRSIVPLGQPVDESERTSGGQAKF